MDGGKGLLKAALGMEGSAESSDALRRHFTILGCGVWTSPEHWGIPHNNSAQSVLRVTPHCPSLGNTPHCPSLGAPQPTWCLTSPQRKPQEKLCSALETLKPCRLLSSPHALLATYFPKKILHLLCSPERRKNSPGRAGLHWWCPRSPHRLQRPRQALSRSRRAFPRSCRSTARCPARSSSALGHGSTTAGLEPQKVLEPPK